VGGHSVKSPPLLFPTSDRKQSATQTGSDRDKQGPDQDKAATAANRRRQLCRPQADRRISKTVMLTTLWPVPIMILIEIRDASFCLGTAELCSLSLRVDSGGVHLVHVPASALPCGLPGRPQDPAPGLQDSVRCPVAVQQCPLLAITDWTANTNWVPIDWNRNPSGFSEICICFQYREHACYASLHETGVSTKGKSKRFFFFYVAQPFLSKRGVTCQNEKRRTTSASAQYIHLLSFAFWIHLFPP